jgi:hypothetical protein
MDEGFVGGIITKWATKMHTIRLRDLDEVKWQLINLSHNI